MFSPKINGNEAATNEAIVPSTFSSLQIALTHLWVALLSLERTALFVAVSPFETENHRTS